MTVEETFDYPTESTIKINPLGDTELFKPIKVGSQTLQNRVVFAPTTRHRAIKGNLPSDLHVPYYDQRTKTPGTLVITEATHISPRSGVYPNVPGIWSDEQVAAWKKVNDKIHENKSFSSIQLWNLGRVTEPQDMKDIGINEILAASPIYFSEESKAAFEETGVTLRSLTTEEIQSFIKKDYTIAAQNAIKAGFDYVEIHNAHGYMLDTFLYPSTNHRTDQYGGSIENRARFTLELVDHLSKVIGADKLAIRISPWATFQGTKGADEEVSPYATFGYLVKELQKRADQGNELAYLSIVEPRVSGNMDVKQGEERGSNDFITEIWKGILLRAGNFTYDAPKFTGLKQQVADNRTLVGFSRYIISNPDLVERLRHGHNLVPYYRPVFYSKGNWGYGTYTAYGEKKVYDKETERNRAPKAIA